MTQTRGEGARPGCTLAATSVAFFMIALDALVVTTALPVMGRDLHAGLPTLQWTVNTYGPAYAAGIITAAALGDRFGRRRVFSSGLAPFTLAGRGHRPRPAPARPAGDEPGQPRTDPRRPWRRPRLTTPPTTYPPEGAVQ